MNSGEPHSSSPNPGHSGTSAPVCPQCGALLYSQRARMCGTCGAVLPAEYVLSDAGVAARARERQWARDLADKFDNATHGTNLVRDSEPPAMSASPQPDYSTVEAAVRRLSCASEFKYRKRPAWLYVAGFVVTLLPGAVIAFFANRYFHLNRETWVAFLVLGGLNAFSWLMLWRNAVPVCPNCHQNIRLCPAVHCQHCGKLLSHLRCTDCGVDNSWIGWLHPSRNGAYGRIIYCPGCGVELDTWVRRWQAGD